MDYNDEPNPQRNPILTTIANILDNEADIIQKDINASKNPMERIRLLGRFDELNIITQNILTRLELLYSTAEDNTPGEEWKNG